MPNSFALRLLVSSKVNSFFFVCLFVCLFVFLLVFFFSPAIFIKIILLL